MRRDEPLGSHEVAAALHSLPVPGLPLPLKAVGSQVATQGRVGVGVGVGAGAGGGVGV